MKSCTFRFDYISQTYIEGTYVNGIKDGVFIKFDKKKDLIKCIIYYKNGKLDGRCHFYNQEGRVNSISLYKEDQLVENICYNKNGKIIINHVFKNGKKIGFEESYLYTGSLRYRYDDYEDGTYEQRYYHEDGTLEVYVNQDIKIYYNWDGKREREIYFRDGKKYIRHYEYCLGNITSYEMSWDEYMDGDWAH
jgi:antitoxin component YwqK of YwqJK toxin-antitoxin module